VNATTDPLDQLVSKIREWAGTHNVRLLDGFVEKEGSLLVLVYNEEGDSSLENFLGAAHAFEIVALFLNITRLTLDELETSIAERGTVKEMDEQERADIRTLRGLEGSVGSIAALELRALTQQPRTLLKFDRFAEWFNLVYASDEREADDDAGIAEEDPAKEALMDELARKVAADRSFQNARNDIQRRTAAGKALGVDAGIQQADWWELLERAKEIYEAESRPSHEAWLVQEAARLKEGGLKRSEIATRLGVSINRVRDLLS